MARGRGHHKIEQEGVVKEIKQNQGVPLIYLPKALLKMGMKLNQEVVVLYNGSNPLAWEITIKPLDKEKA